MIKVKNSGSSAKNIFLVIIFALIAIWGVRLKFSRQQAGTPNPSIPAMTQQIDTVGTGSQSSISPQLSGPAADNRSYYNYMVRTIIVTAIMLGLILLMYFYFKRRTKSDTGGSGDIQVLGRRYLSNRQYLLLIRAENKKLLLGVTEHNINFLTEMAEKEADPEREEKIEAEPMPSDGFSNILKKINIRDESDA